MTPRTIFTLFYLGDCHGPPVEVETGKFRNILHAKGEWFAPEQMEKRSTRGHYIIVNSDTAQARTYALCREPRLVERHHVRVEGV
jgi:hypothetical protein